MIFSGIEKYITKRYEKDGIISIHLEFPVSQRLEIMDILDDSNWEIRRSGPLESDFTKHLIKAEKESQNETDTSR